MLMLDPNLLSSEWFVDLDVSDRYMFIYLLAVSDNKIGTVEWNERMINFCANVPKHYKKSDILRIYSGRIQCVPGHENTLIFPQYVSWNWAKGGRELDERKPLDKSIIKALARYDLTIDKLNEMSTHKVKVINEEVNDDDDDSGACADGDAPCGRIGDIKTGATEKDIDEMFNAFWSAYPGPRKQDKKKCRAKFAKLLGNDPDKAVSMFNRMMDGIEKWKRTDTWTKDEGAYICAPLVWLNNERYDAEVKEGRHGNSGKCGSANANYKSADASGIF